RRYIVRRHPKPRFFPGSLLCSLRQEVPMEVKMAKEATWKPHTAHGTLDTADREKLPDSVYAFPEKRKEPMTDADHVRNAMARFDQVEGVSDAERDLAWANIKKAARHYDIEIEEQDWHDLGKHPHTKNPAH